MADLLGQQVFAVVANLRIISPVMTPGQQNITHRGV
jgi:hypothetical protein